MNKNGGKPVRPKDVSLTCGVCGLGDGVVSEEVAVSRRKMCPKGPTPKEVEEHEETHLPFRNWCEVCIAARGIDDGHPDRKLLKIARKCTWITVS